ncbi:unnamed protein product [Urochloa humidicola]
MQRFLHLLKYACLQLRHPGDVALLQALPQKLLVQPSVEELHIWSHWQQGGFCAASWPSEEERTSTMQTTVMVAIFREEVAPEAILKSKQLFFFVGSKKQSYLEL